MDSKVVNIEYIEKLLKDPGSSRISLSITCAEDFHFIGAIYMDGGRLFSRQSSELDKLLFDINEKCHTLLES